MKLRTKRKIKRIIGWLLGIVTLLTALLFAYFKNRLIETSISIFLFYVFKNLFDKQWHASSTYMCFIVTSIVLILIIYLEIPLSVSILFSAIITFILTYISYHVKIYYEDRAIINRLKKYKIKAIENLTLEELLNKLPNIKEDIIRIVYGYWHRERGVTLLEYVDSCHISQPLLYNYINKVKNAYKDLTEIC